MHAPISSVTAMSNERPLPASGTPRASCASARSRSCSGRVERLVTTPQTVHSFTGQPALARSPWRRVWKPSCPPLNIETSVSPVEAAVYSPTVLRPVEPALRSPRSAVRQLVSRGPSPVADRFDRDLPDPVRGDCLSATGARRYAGTREDLGVDERDARRARVAGGGGRRRARIADPRSTCRRPGTGPSPLTARPPSRMR